MDYADKKILENEIATPIGRAVSQWMKKNRIEEPVSITASVVHPSCYVDEQGMSHTGPLIICNVRIVDDEEWDDEDD